MSDHKYPTPPADFHDAIEEVIVPEVGREVDEGLPQPEQVTVDPAQEKADFAELLSLLKQSEEEDPDTSVTILSLDEFSQETFVPSADDIIEGVPTDE